MRGDNTLLIALGVIAFLWLTKRSQVFGGQLASFDVPQGNTPAAPDATSVAEWPTNLSITIAQPQFAAPVSGVRGCC